MNVTSTNELHNPLHSPVLWLHVHKAAGSMMCALAKKNGETSASGLGSNCNLCGDSCSPPSAHPTIGNATFQPNMCGADVQPGPTPNEPTAAFQAARPPSTWWLNFTKSCAQRRLEGQRSSFMSLERWMDDEMCPGLLYGIALRDPLDRMVSNTRYSWFHKWSAPPEHVVRLASKGASGCYDRRVRNTLMNSWEDCFHVECATVERSVASYDNLYTRTLAGKDVFMLPAGAVTRAHLEQAKARLSQFTIVILLEKFSQHNAQLESILQWKCPSRKCAIGNAHSTRYAGGKNFSAQELKGLREANRLDYELYRFAGDLARNRTAAAGPTLALLKRRARAGPGVLRQTGSGGENRTV